MKHRILILLTIALALVAFSGANAGPANAYCDGAYWNVAHENFSPSEGHSCQQFGDTYDEQILSTFSPFDSTLAILTTAGGTWEGSGLLAYNQWAAFAPIPHSNDKVGCYNHHTANQWVNCKHDDCTDPTFCTRPFAPFSSASALIPSGSASTTRDLARAIPFASATVDASLGSQIVQWALSRNIDPSGLIEVGAVALGKHTYGAVVGRDKSGAVYVAFLGGIWNTSFVPASDLVGKARPLYAETSASRIALAGVEAGVTGVVTRATDHVLIERADGVVFRANPIAWGRSPYGSFTFATADSAALPRVVRAYDSRGSLLATERLPTRPIELSPADK